MLVTFDSDGKSKRTLAVHVCKSPKIWLGACGAFLETLTLFQTKTVAQWLERPTGVR